MWRCGACGVRWPEAVATCIDCLRNERDDWKRQWESAVEDIATVAGEAALLRAEVEALRAAEESP